MATTSVKINQLTPGTDGELITWDSSGNPTTVAVGTSGQVLTSNGTGAAPTFQAPSEDGNGIYDGSGTVPSSTVATATGGFTMNTNGASTIILGDNTSTLYGVVAQVVPGGVFIGSPSYYVIANHEDSHTDIVGGSSSLEVGSSTATFRTPFLGIQSSTSSVAGQLRFFEGTDNGSNYVSFKAADTLSGNISYVLPTSVTDGYFLKYNSSGNQLEWAAGGTTSPAGSNTQIQFNNSGSFGADAGLTYNTSTDTFTVNSLVLDGTSEYIHGATNLYLSATGSSGSLVTLSDTSPWLDLSNSGYDSDATDLVRVQIGGSFVPDGAGSSTHTSLLINPTINETGTHAGDTFGLAILPTLTSVGGNFYGIYTNITDADSFNIAVAGTSPNYFGGPVMVGDVQAPQTGATFEVNSTTGGLLLPRMTTTERNALAATPNGLQIYNSTTDEFQFYQDGSWEVLGGGSGDGNGIYSDGANTVGAGVEATLQEDDFLYIKYFGGNNAITINDLNGWISFSDKNEATAVEVSTDELYFYTESGAEIYLNGESISTGADLFGISYTTTATNVVEDRLVVGTNSSGTAAAGFGSGILFQGESSTTASQDMARISSLWTDATHGSRESVIAFSTVTAAGSLTERVRIVDEGLLIGTTTEVAGYDIVSAGPIRTNAGHLLSRGAGAPGSTTAAAAVRLFNTTGSGQLDIGVEDDDEVVFITSEASEVAKITTDGVWSFNYGIRNRQQTYAPTFTSNNYTLIIGDEGYLLQLSNGGTAGTLTVPANASVAFPIGTRIDCVQTGSGVITFTPGGGVTINSYDSLVDFAGIYASATLVKTATNTWLLVGNIA
jgi:hypothetical protein